MFVVITSFSFLVHEHVGVSLSRQRGFTEVIYELLSVLAINYLKPIAFEQIFLKICTETNTFRIDSKSTYKILTIRLLNSIPATMKGVTPAAGYKEKVQTHKTTKIFINDNEEKKGKERN